MEFLVKKTTELTENECDEMLRLFNDVFHESRTLLEFKNQYLNNVLGFAYHSLIVEQGQIVGTNAFIPGYYLVGAKKCLFAVSIDTMIRKSHRGIENFYDLVHTAYKRLSDEGIAFVMGFPNDQSYPIFTATGLMPLIGRLSTYCLPLHIGGLNKRFRFMNVFSNLFCQCLLNVSLIFASDTIYTPLIHKETESYNRFRYKRMDGNYQIVSLPNLEFFYKIKTIEGIRTATLIDVTQKSPKSFCKAVKYIVKHEKQNVDLLLYVGNTPFGITGMIKVPRRFEPKRFNFNGILIDRAADDLNTVNKIENWDVNLSDFDLI